MRSDHPSEIHFFMCPVLLPQASVSDVQKDRQTGSWRFGWRDCGLSSQSCGCRRRRSQSCLV